jgi:hypothetical protein
MSKHKRNSQKLYCRAISSLGVRRRRRRRRRRGRGYICTQCWY